MSKVHVKTGDTVVLLTGKDEYLYNDPKDKSKGRKTGKVVAVSPKEGKVIVEGFNVVTKHVKPTRMGQVGILLRCLRRNGRYQGRPRSLPEVRQAHQNRSRDRGRQETACLQEQGLRQII
jgi:hypothetical protein